MKASKAALNKAKELWQKFTENAKPFVKGLVTDTEIGAASEEYFIIRSLIPHKEQELNEKLEIIEEAFKEVNDINVKMIFINTQQWEKEKNKYIENLKNGYKYSYKEEPLVKENNDDKDLESIANNIFEVNKIELQ